MKTEKIVRYTILVEIGARIEDNEYDFEVIDFERWESRGYDRKSALNFVIDKVTEWTVKNGYNDRSIYDRKIWATPIR